MTSPMFRLTLLLGCLLGLASCSSVERAMEDAMSMGETDTDRHDGRFYVAPASLPLYREPSFTSEQIAELPHDTALDRDDIDSGFAHVRVVATGQTGWVDNAKLDWRAPGKAASDTQTKVEPEEEPAEEAEAEAQPKPAPTPDLSPPTAPADAAGTTTEGEKRVDPALFDAF